MIHLNTAGAGLMPDPVVSAMVDCVRREAATGAYETERFYDDVLQKQVYLKLGALLGAPADDIALFDSATRAWCAVVCRLDLGPIDRVWVTPYEYAGNLISLQNLRDRTGCLIELIPLLPNGDLDLEWMRASISDEVAFVSITAVPSGCGIVNPIAEIGRILAGQRCFYAVDACQVVGQLDIDVTRIGCDLLTGAGRKFLRGPRGTGFAYVAPRLRDALRLEFHDLHVARATSLDDHLVEDDSARVLELAERTTAAIVGLDAALAHAERVGAFDNGDVLQALRAGVGAVPGMELITPGTVQSGIVSFRHESVPAERIRSELGQRGINAWTIRGDHTPLYLSRRGIDTAVRASVHYYNTVAEVDVAVRALRQIVAV
jgi:selenocysteine lyase/cysteine desulfurase